MLSYTGRRNLFGDLTNNAGATHLALGDTLMNSVMQQVLNMRSWWFLFTTGTEDTVASQANYDLPGNCAKLIGDPYITVSSTRYTPKRVVSRQDWDRLVKTSRTGDIPEKYFVFGNEVHFYPAPATDSNVITFPCRKKVRNLSIADYTTGTVSATNGSKTITGAGTTWVADMASRYIKITPADAGGDGLWYEIETFTSTTSMSLKREYSGTTCTGAACAVGEMSGLPEGYDEITVYRACQIYFTSIKPDKTKALLYKDLADALTVALVDDHGSATDMVTSDGMDGSQGNPNLFVSL